jgi:ankyrin repeat protein
MAKKIKELPYYLTNVRPEIDALLQSTSDSLFPAQLGEAKVSIDSANSDGDTPLHVLIWRGDSQGALLLIQYGAPLDAVGDMGETPLHVAISRNDRIVIRELLKAGARTDIVSEFGQTASQKAAEKGIDLH